MHEGIRSNFHYLIENIEKVAFLRDREEQFYETLLPNLQESHYKHDEIIFKEGSRPLHCHILIKGKVVNIISLYLPLVQ